MAVNPFALTDGVPETRVAQRLVDARRRAGITRRRASRQTGVARSNLVRIEKGRMRPPDGTLIALCRSYGVTLTWLIPERSGNLVRVTPESIEVAGRSRVLGGEDPDVDVVLRSYLSLVRELRGAANGSVVHLRDEDLAALAQALGDTPSEIEARLVDLMMLSRDEARIIRRELVKRRVGAPAAGLLLASAVFTSTLDSGSDDTGVAAHEASTSAVVTPSAVSVERVTDTPAVERSVEVKAATFTAPEPVITPSVGDEPSPLAVLIGDAFAIERPAEESVVDVAPPSFVPLPENVVGVPVIGDAAPVLEAPAAPVVDDVDVVVPPADVVVPPADVVVPPPAGDEDVVVPPVVEDEVDDAPGRSGEAPGHTGETPAESGETPSSNAPVETPSSNAPVETPAESGETPSSNVPVETPAEVPAAPPAVLPVEPPVEPPVETPAASDGKKDKSNGKSDEEHGKDDEAKAAHKPK